MTATESTGPLLQVRDVRAAYVKKEVLRGVSLSVQQGEIVALLGGNGSGKSTLLKTIAGLLVPTAGRIHINGTDVTQWRVYERQREGLGFLLQGGRVFPNLSVAENFEAARQFRSRRRHRPPELLLGGLFPELAERAQSRAGLLSGGQRQMLSIEMVVVQQPRVLLLDEPTSALAPNLAHNVLQAISEHIKPAGCCALLVEQNVGEALRVARRVYRLVDGESIEELSEHVESA